VEAERVNRALGRGDCWTPTPVRHDVGGRPPICPALNPWSFLSPVLRTTRNSRRLGKPPNDYSSEGARLAGPRARSSAGQGCLSSTARRPVWRLLVTSGGATPAMLRAAPETERAPGSQRAWALVRPRLREGLLGTGRVARPESQRRWQTAPWTPKPDFPSIFTEEGGDAAVCHLRPRGLARLWRWFPPPLDKALASLGGSIPDFVPELGNLRVLLCLVPGQVATLKKISLQKLMPRKPRVEVRGVGWTWCVYKAAQGPGARLGVSSPLQERKKFGFGGF